MQPRQARLLADGNVGELERLDRQSRCPDDLLDDEHAAGVRQACRSTARCARGAGPGRRG